MLVTQRRPRGISKNACLGQNTGTSRLPARPRKLPPAAFWSFLLACNAGDLVAGEYCQLRTPPSEIGGATPNQEKSSMAATVVRSATA